MPAATQLLGKLRSGFTSQGSVTTDQLFQAVTPVPSSSSASAPSSIVSPPTLAPSHPTSPILQSQLDTLDEVLTEVEAQFVSAPPSPPVDGVPEVAATTPIAPVIDPVTTVAAAVPTAVAQATNTLNPHTITLSAKELAQPLVTAEAAPAQAIDLGGGYQVVEVEPASELPPEVDGYLKEVQNHAEQQPQEIVIADGSMQLMPPPVPMKKVVVLPITPEEERQGARKGTKNSFRWLVEWSRRLMKMFSGKIIYNQEST